MAAKRYLALLRAVNVGGRKVPMADLRKLAEGLGWNEVATYIQSGNLVFTAEGKPTELEAELETALKKQFGFEVPVIVRDQEQWDQCLAANPFHEAAETDARLLLLGVAKEPIRGQADEELKEIAGDVERVARDGEAFWIHFREGSARSRLTPKALDRAAGSPVTTRNWRTCMKLQEMLRVS